MWFPATGGQPVEVAVLPSDETVDARTDEYGCGNRVFLTSGRL